MGKIVLYMAKCWIHPQIFFYYGKSKTKTLIKAVHVSDGTSIKWPINHKRIWHFLSMLTYWDQKERSTGKHSSQDAKVMLVFATYIQRRAKLQLNDTKVHEWKMFIRWKPGMYFNKMLDSDKRIGVGNVCKQTHTAPQASPVWHV